LTVQGYFYAWSRGGLLERINHALVVAAREKARREANQRGVVDSQPAKTTERGGRRGLPDLTLTAADAELYL
jgi:putative transposase